MTTELDAAIRLKLVDEVTAKARQIADQFGVVGAEALSGTGVASKAFEDLKLRELAAREEARRLAAELRRLRSSGGGTEQQIQELAVQLIRSKEAAREYAASARNVQRASTDMGRAAAGASSSLARSTGRQAQAASRSVSASTASAGAMALVSKESKNAGREMGGMINVVAEMGYSFATAIPGMQQAGTQMAMMGGSAYQLGAGFGVWGAAAGAAIGLMPMVIDFFASATDGAHDLTNANAEATQSFQDLADAIEQQHQAEQRKADRATGAASVAEQQASLEAAERTLANARADQQRMQERLTPAQQSEIAKLRRADVGDFDSALEYYSQPALEEAGVDNLRDLSPLARGRVLAQARGVVPLLEQENLARTRIASAEGAVTTYRAALEAAEERQEREQTRSRLEERAQQTSDLATGLLDNTGVTGRRGQRLRRAVNAGDLRSASGIVGSERATELIRAREAANTAAGALARHNLEERADELGVELSAEATSPAAEPEIRQVRRLRAPAAAPAPAPAPPEDTSFLARFAEDLDRARLRVIVEDRRITTTVEGGGARVPIEADTVSSQLVGGQP